MLPRDAVRTDAPRAKRKGVTSAAKARQGNSGVREGKARAARTGAVDTRKLGGTRGDLSMLPGGRATVVGKDRRARTTALVSGARREEAGKRGELEDRRDEDGHKRIRSIPARLLD